jgi:hypothetical protein
MRFSSLSPASLVERGGSAIRWDALRRHGLTEGEMADAQQVSSEIWLHASWTERERFGRHIRGSHRWRDSARSWHANGGIIVPGTMGGNERMADVASDSVVVLKAKLDLLVGAPELFGDEPTPEERVVIDEAIHNFRVAGATVLDEATPFLWEYYRSVASAFGQREREEYGIPELNGGADIWDEVQLVSPPRIQLGGGRLQPGRSYISFEGGVTWELEHGLQLVFEHGLHVCKVGPYDDHNTNAHAYGREDLLGVIFK